MSNATALSAALDATNARLLDLYERLAPDATAPDIATRLHGAVEDAIQTARMDANLQAVLDVEEELVSVVGEPGRISLSPPRDPKPSEVVKYTAKAVDHALAKIAEAVADGGGWEQALVDSVWRAQVIAESEACGTYERSKQFAMQQLADLPDDPARGFLVAHSSGQLHTGQAREQGDSLIAVFGKRWSAVNDSRTCERCRSLDGEMALMGIGAFSASGPPAHARCRCISHLWAVGWPFDGSEKAMPELTRWFADFDVRAPGVSVDAATRTIKGAVASDESLDSHGTVIKADGWDLEQYQRNPVLVWAHKTGRYDDVQPDDILGTATVRKQDGKLLADLHFEEADINPQAGKVFRKMTSDPPSIRMLSVGFVPLEYHEEKADGGSVLVFDRAELAELSVVPLGSNKNALAPGQRSTFLARCHGGAGDAAVPHEEIVMDKTDNTVVVALPSELASRMGAATVEEAVRKWAELELKLDKAEKARLDADTRATAAEKALADKVDTDATACVDGLIKSGRISDARRESALTLARANLDAFRDQYPDEPAAPMAHLLTKVTPAVEPAGTPPAIDTITAGIGKRIHELVAAGTNPAEAHERAHTEALRALEGA